MLKKSFLTIIFIIFASWSPLSEGVHAACYPCTPEQQGTCTNINIAYKELPDFPSRAIWTADMWYTHCGDKSESGVAFYAGDWNNNQCCVQPGTRVRIGQMGTPTNFVDQVVTGPQFNVICYSSSEPANDVNNCVDANNFPPRCTKVTVKYLPGSKGSDSIVYTPCRGNKEKTVKLWGLAPPYFPDSFDINTGSRVQIGPELTKTNFIDEKMSGAEVNVHCYGDTSAKGGCCVDGRPNCPPKTTEPTKGKTPKETPGTKAKETEQKTSGEEKRK